MAATKIASSINHAASASRRSYNASCCCSPIVFRSVELSRQQSVSIADVVIVAITAAGC